MYVTLIITLSVVMYIGVDLKIQEEGTAVIKCFGKCIVCMHFLVIELHMSYSCDYRICAG